MLIISTNILAGCWDQKIFERTGFILQIGLELDKEGKLMYTATMPVFSEDMEDKIEVLTTSANLLRESRENIRNYTGKRVEGGKTQNIIFSRDLAQNGVQDLLEIFMRSPENPLLANIIVIDGSPKEMFEISKQYKDKPRSAFYIVQLLEDARKRTATPETRIYNFLIDVNSETIDPIATYMSFSDIEYSIIGSALFNGDRMVGEIGIVETGLLHAIMGEDKNFEYYYRESTQEDEKDDGKNGAAILLKKVKRKVNIAIEDNKPIIDLRLEFTASLDEYKWNQRFDEVETEQKFIEKVEEAIKKDCMKILEYLKEIGSDPAGFGEMYRVKEGEYFKSVKWDDVYKDAHFNVDVGLNIEFYGVID